MGRDDRRKVSGGWIVECSEVTTRSVDFVLWARGGGGHQWLGRRDEPGTRCV